MRRNPFWIGILAAALSAAVPAADEAALAAGADPVPAAVAVMEIGAVLDDWHDAAAKADEARYFGHFHHDAVFLGTDGSERWTLAEFRAYAAPHFAKGTAWTLAPRDRRVTLSPDGKAAWFDEAVDSARYGPGRGSGVLVNDGRDWKIAQYNYSVPVPNDLLLKVVELIKAAARAAKGPAGKAPREPAAGTR